MDSKEKLFKTIERIEELKKIPAVFMSEEEDLELRNLEVLKMKYYSDWKD